MKELALLFFKLHSLINYSARSIKHKRVGPKLPYFEFATKIQYYFVTYLVMIPISKMTSGHLMNISTSILRCWYTAFMSNRSGTHPYSLWYKLSPIRILVDVSDKTGDNDSVNSTPRNLMHPLTTFINFIPINQSGSFLLLHKHLKGTGFLIFLSRIFYL